MIGNPLSLEHFSPAENDIDSVHCKIHYFVFFFRKSSCILWDSVFQKIKFRYSLHNKGVFKITRLVFFLWKIWSVWIDDTNPLISVINIALCNSQNSFQCLIFRLSIEDPSVIQNTTQPVIIFTGFPKGQVRKFQTVTLYSHEKKIDMKKFRNFLLISLKIS